LEPRRAAGLPEEPEARRALIVARVAAMRAEAEAAAAESAPPPPPSATVDQLDEFLASADLDGDDDEDEDEEEGTTT
jgi:hypothetical protein